MSNEPLEWDFFLAHASADRNRAESLYEALRTDHRVFLDTHSVHPGDDWARTIQRALGSARFTIILISANSEKAHYLQDEIRTAIQLARQDAKRRRVIPVFLDGFPSDINAVPYGLGSIQWLDARNLGMEGIAAALRKAAAPQGLGTAPEHLQGNQGITSTTAEQKRSQEQPAHQTSAFGPVSPTTASATHSSPPANVPSTAKPTKPKQNTPRRSAPGCVIVALLLTAGAVGLTALRSDTPDDHGTRRSILLTLLDGLKNPSPPSALVPPAPSPTIQLSSQGIAGLRRLHNVRTLQPSEFGQTIGNIPSGIYGFVEPQAPEYLPKARVYGSSTNGSLEIHKLDNGSLMIVGFIRDADVRTLSQGGPSQIALLPTASIQARTAGAIPLEWIRSLYFRNQGDILLELSPHATSIQQ